MKCTEFQDNLFAYQEGGLAPETRKLMVEHTKACKSCSRILEGFDAIESAISAEKAKQPNPFAATRIIQRLENKAERRGGALIPVLRPVVITFLLLAALLTGFLVGNHGTSRKMQVSANNTTIEVLKTDFYVYDFADEDITLITNE
jgi:hypothetical protein